MEETEKGLGLLLDWAYMVLERPSEIGLVDHSPRTGGEVGEGKQVSLMWS